MSNHWLRVMVPIALLYACRLLGLFLLMPVFSVYATQLHHATPQLIGLALGAYGLSQACMQIPFGVLSDRLGRKTLITIGLILLMIGSLIGATTHSIYGMLFARILQGSGAIGSVLLALVGDLIPSQHRAKAMAMIGVSIGVAFSIAMVLGPMLTHHFGLSSLFYLTACLALLGLGLLHYNLATPELVRHPTPFRLHEFKHHLLNPQLAKLNLGIFLQHLLLTATFFALPMQLHHFMHQGLLSTSWHFYLPIVLLSFVSMAPIVALSEKKQCIPAVLKVVVFIFALTQTFLAAYVTHWHALILLFFLYFIAFNVGEAFLPSLVSHAAPPTQRGTALGIYSTSQFLGIFVGGVMAGMVYPYWGMPGIFCINALLAFAWFFMIRSA